MSEVHGNGMWAQPQLSNGLDETRGARRPALIVTGVVLAVAGLAAAVVLWLAAGQRFDDAIEKLAPAPVGCDTTLEFDSGGTFYVFAETKGEVGEVDGDCENDEQKYDGEDADLDVVMFDGEQSELDLDRDDGVSYDNGSSEGESLYTVDIPDEGEYTLRVEGADSEVVARVGPDPNDGVGLLKVGAVVAGIAGLVLGALFVIFGTRRRHPSAAAPVGPASTGWTPDYPPGFGPPTAPPSAPPTGEYPPVSGAPAPGDSPRPGPPPTWGPPG